MNKRLTLADADAAASSKGGVCLSRVYINSRTKLRWRCKEGHEWDAALNRVRGAGTWCAKCFGNKRLSIGDARRAALERGGECLSAAYANANALLRWRCKEGHEWSDALSSVKYRKTWCPECALALRLENDAAHALIAKQLARAFGAEVLTRLTQAK